MIREINRTAVVVPNLYRSRFPNIVKHEEVMFMIKALVSEIKTISCEYKYCKLIMMRHHISLDMFILFKSFLVKDSYYLIKQHSVIMHPKTIIVSKLHRLGYITDDNYHSANAISYSDMLLRQFPGWIQGPNLLREITYWI
jgi:hypothetical protein